MSQSVCVAACMCYQTSAEIADVLACIFIIDAYAAAEALLPELELVLAVPVDELVELTPWAPPWWCPLTWLFISDCNWVWFCGAVVELPDCTAWIKDAKSWLKLDCVEPAVAVPPAWVELLDCKAVKADCALLVLLDWMLLIKLAKVVASGLDCCVADVPVKP